MTFASTSANANANNMASASANANATELLNTNDFDLDRLIDRIDSFLTQKSPGGKNRSAHAFSDIIQPASGDISKLLEGVSQGAKMISDQRKLLSNLSSEAQKTAVSVLNGIGNAHWAAAGFLVLASVLERLEKVSFNKKECFILLKRMNDLAKCIKQLKSKSGLDSVLEKKTEDALRFIVQGAIMCFTQIGMRKCYKFLLVSKNREDLVQVDRDIQHLYRDLTLCLSASNVVYRPVEMPYPEHAIGIQDQVQAVTKKLDCQSDTAAIAVIVYGVGGIGKTTIADAVFANLQQGVEPAYQTAIIKLNEDIHLNPKIEELQAQILQKLTGQKHEITHYKIGQDEIKKCLKKGPVLLYVDNVLRREYLEQILPKKLDSPKKFRLLLTARKRDVVATVESCGIEHCKDYEIEPLSIKDCIDLLCSKIGMDRDHNNHKINKIAAKCSGIPLVLEVVGGYLRRAIKRDNMEAQASIERVLQGLEKGEAFSGDAQDMGYESKLLFAFDDLTQTAQDAFLDICIFFHRWDWEEVASIVGEEELRTLREGALVKKIGDEANVHDVLVGIGRNKSKGIRITSTEELSSALLVRKNVDGIKGIWLSGNRVPYSELSAEKLDQMHQSLRVLALGDWTIINGMCNNTFHSLRFLQAGDVPYLPFNMALLSHLKYLDNGSGKHICFNTPSQIPQTLAVLKLRERSYCERFEIIPQILAKLTNLRSLELQGFVGLIELNERFGHLRKLVQLDLSQCGMLQLPQGLGQLKSMQTLNLSGCKGLKELPESFGELECLETLRLEGCTTLKCLPSSFGSLKSLKYVSLKHCRSLQELPESFGSLSRLRHLDLSHCDSINALPSSFEQLSSLRFLSLIWCNSLLYLPDNLGNLTSLVELELFCRNLARLPNSIGQLKSLSRYMLMYQCFALKQLPEEICELNLESLGLPDCIRLEKLPDRFKEFTRLKHLRLCTCQSLVRLPQGFGTLQALEELDLNSCIKLQELCSDFECLSSLKKLRLSKCVELKGLWLDSVIKVRPLNYVDIKGSLQLKDRWMKLRKEKDWEILVNTEEDDEDGRLMRKAASMFFNDECLLFDCNGCQFKPSTLLPNTTLVLVFEWNISKDSWIQFMENIRGLLEESIDSQVIYIRKSFPVSNASVQASMEAKKGTTLGLPCDYSKVSLAFETILSKVIGPSYSYGSPGYAISTSVIEKDGTKQFSKWENISSLFHEKNFKSENYVRIKKLVEVAQSSNTELLKSLLVTEGKDFILLNSWKQVSIDSLQGKVVLLLISRLDIFPMEICVLKEIYIKNCDTRQFEVVWMPIVDPYHDTWGSYVRAVENMPWPAMRDPWSIEPAVLKFVREDLNFESSPLLVVVNDKGSTLRNRNLKEMVERWGMEAHPFTIDKVNRLKKAELDELKAKSSIEFLFQNFDCSQQVKEAMLQGQQICLYGGDPQQILDFTPTLGSSGLSASVQIIYVGRRHAEANNLNSEETMHERNRQRMDWLSLSYMDAWKFWQHVGYLVQGLVNSDDHENLVKYRVSLGILSLNNRSGRGVWMAMVDEGGEVMSDSSRQRVVQQLNKGKECRTDLVMEGISCGEVEELLKRRFENGLFHQEHHAHHSLLPFRKVSVDEWEIICDMCGGELIKSSYYRKCTSCPLGLCLECYDLSSALIKKKAKGQSD